MFEQKTMDMIYNVLKKNCKGTQTLLLSIEQICIFISDIGLLDLKQVLVWQRNFILRIIYVV